MFTDSHDGLLSNVRHPHFSWILRKESEMFVLMNAGAERWPPCNDLAYVLAARMIPKRTLYSPRPPWFCMVGRWATCIHRGIQLFLKAPQALRTCCLPALWGELQGGTWEGSLTREDCCSTEWSLGVPAGSHVSLGRQGKNVRKSIWNQSRMSQSAVSQKM